MYQVEDLIQRCLMVCDYAADFQLMAAEILPCNSIQLFLHPNPNLCSVIDYHVNQDVPRSWLLMTELRLLLG